MDTETAVDRVPGTPGVVGMAPVSPRIGSAIHKVPLLLFFALLLLYTLTLQTSLSSDCIPNAYLPLSVLKHGSISLGFFSELYARGRPYFLVPYGGGLHSIFGIGAPLFALPFYLPFLFRDSTPSFTTLIYVSKLAASFYVSLSAALLFAALRRLTTQRRALLITTVYALATPAFCTASQALWQHGPSLFLLSLGIYLLVRGIERPRWSAWPALPLGISVLVRTTNLVFLPPVIIYLGWKKRRELPWFLLLLLPGALATAFYNHAAYGSVFRFPLMAPKYLLPAGEFMAYNEYNGFWRTPFLTGFFGNLISPSRGLLAISPVLILAFLGPATLISKSFRKDRSYTELALCFFAAFLLQLLLVAKKTDWTGGSSFGNRLLIDTLPFLVFLILPAMEFVGEHARQAVRKCAWSIFILLFAVSFALQLEGIIPYDRGSWDLQGPIDRRAWDWHDSQVAFYLKHPEPVVPPLVREITGKAPGVADLEIGVLEGRPYLRFRMSEYAKIIWKVISMQDAETEFSLPFYAAKGENELLFAEEYFGENGREAMERLIRMLAMPCRHEFVVMDPLTGVENRHLLVTSAIPP